MNLVASDVEHLQPSSSLASLWLSLLSDTGALDAADSSIALPVALLAAALVRWTVSLNGYSGKAQSPLYGDFEAQRHWIELTTHLPTSQWYRYDLQYWGLDYPPLTAYHSWLLGLIANWINPAWIALDTSRGYESPELQLFMRYTALFTDLLIHATAAIAFCWYCVFTIRGVASGGRRANKVIIQDKQEWFSRNYLLIGILLQPALIIIDHGHFQYNAAMLGFTLWAIVFFFQERFMLGSIMFCLSLNFKQMALFYALPVFFFLLGRCIQRGPVLLVKLGISVIATFTVCLAPFLSSMDDTLQVFKRVFPFERGLYEDKVANVWCALNVAVKLRQMFDVKNLAFVSAISTLVVLAPCCIDVMMRPSNKRFIYALLNGSLSFFLFSFQVHEKSILLPLLPASLLLLEEHYVVMTFFNTAMFSMYPLLKRDELIVPTLCLTCLFNLIMGSPLSSSRNSSFIVRAVIVVLHGAMVVLVGAEFFLPAPTKYPDLYVVMNAVLSAGIFLVLLIWFNVKQQMLVDPSVQASVTVAHKKKIS